MAKKRKKVSKARVVVAMPKFDGGCVIASLSFTKLLIDTSNKLWLLHETGKIYPVKLG